MRRYPENLPFFGPAEVEAIIERRRAGEKVPDIARDLGVSTSLIYKVSGGLGLHSGPTGRREVLPGPAKAEVRALRAQGWTQEQLAERFGVCNHTIRRALRELLPRVDLRRTDPFSPWDLAEGPEQPEDGWPAPDDEG